MARVTVEDCVEKVPNRFGLVLMASHRARAISSGSPLTIDRDNDKNPVVALREIADSTISPEDLKEELVHSLQKYVEDDEPEPEAVALVTGFGPDVVWTEVMRAAVRIRISDGLCQPTETGNSDWKALRARKSRLFTVPTGTPIASEISSYVRSSTSRITKGMRW